MLVFEGLKKVHILIEPLGKGRFLNVLADRLWWLCFVLLMDFWPGKGYRSAS